MTQDTKKDEGRIYRAQPLDADGNPKGEPRLIHAKTPAQARRHASKDQWAIDVIGTIDLAQLMARGITVESARSDE